MHNNLLLWPDELLHDAASSPDGVARSWLDPRQFSEIVGVDFGLGKMHYYMAVAGRRRCVAIDAAIHTLLSFSANTLVICEWAHLAVPQKAKSLAQLFTEEQLSGLYEQAKSRGITIKLFPHAHSGKRAREWVAFNYPDHVAREKTSDINDAVSLALYVTHCNGISLANPPRSFQRCSKREYGRAVISLSNIVLNAERTRGYEGRLFPLVVALARTVKKKAGGSPIDKTVAISIVSTIVHELDGRMVLFVRKGRAVGARLWIRHVMHFSPFHHRGGIVRSNLMWHKFRHWFARYAARNGVNVKAGKKCMKYGHFDARQKAMHAQAMRRFRAAVINAYRIAVDLAEQSGCERMDPHDVLREVNNGR